MKLYLARYINFHCNSSHFLHQVEQYEVMQRIEHYQALSIIHVNKPF